MASFARGVSHKYLSSILLRIYNFLIYKVSFEFHFILTIFIQRFFYNGTAASTEGVGAIFDTGSTMIAGPISVVAPFREYIGAVYIGPGQYTVDCEVVDQLPPVQFKFGGKNYELSGPDYVITVK